MKVGEVALGLEWRSRYQGFLKWLTNERVALIIHRDMCVITFVCIDCKDHASFLLLIPHSSDCEVGDMYSEMTIKLISDEQYFWQIQQDVCNLVLLAQQYFIYMFFSFQNSNSTFCISTIIFLLTKHDTIKLPQLNYGSGVLFIILYPQLLSFK